MKLKYFLLVFILILSSCGDYKTENGYVSKKNIKVYLDRLTKGSTYKNKAVTNKKELNDLEEYIIARKDKIYKDENEFLLHNGLISLYRSDFPNAFRTLREYIEITSEKSRVYYNIAKVISYQDWKSGDDILGLAALYTRDTFPEPLDINQHVSLLQWTSGYPSLIMAPYILNNEEILNHKKLTFDFQKKIERLNRIEVDQITIDQKALLTLLDESQVEDMLDSNLSRLTLKLDYAIAYYIHPIRQNYKKAVFYADQRDYKEWIRPYPSFRIPDLMRAYIGNGDYKKAIEIYDYHKDSYDIMGESLTHLNLLVAAAYAGLNEMDLSFEYLSNELEITEIRESNSSSSSNSISINFKGDMLCSLFEVYFYFDEFKKFEEAPWQEKFENMINLNIKRYSDLRLFNR